MKLPKLVAIEFLDHIHYSGDGPDCKPIQCEVCGILYKEDNDAYYVASWVSGGVIDDNAEQFVILKAAVKKLNILHAAGGRHEKRRAKSKKAK